MSGDQIRISRSEVEDHADRTKGNLGRMQTSALAADRQHQNRVNQLDGGVGSERAGDLRRGTRRSNDDVQDGVTRATSKGVENVNEFTGRVTNAANQM